jgi:outer membrane biosynthesis protein TonB
MQAARRYRRTASAVFAVALGLNLAACESFDIGDLLPDTKKKLAGERKEVFPGGVPGVAQGIPQELIKGNTPPEDPNAAALEQVRQAEEKKAAERQAAEERAKQAAKPRRVAAPKPAPQPQQQDAQPAQGSAWPNQPPPPQQQARPAASSWPSSPQQQQQQQAGQSGWPAPPQAGTFSR